MRNRIAYCGLDCEKCDAYLATINDDQALRENTAKTIAEYSFHSINTTSFTIDMFRQVHKPVKILL